MSRRTGKEYGKFDNTYSKILKKQHKQGKISDENYKEAKRLQKNKKAINPKYIF